MNQPDRLGKEETIPTYYRKPVQQYIKERKLKANILYEITEGINLYNRQTGVSQGI